MKILGIKPRFFRPRTSSPSSSSSPPADRTIAYGAYNEASLQYLKSRGYETVTWSFDSGDSEGVSPAKSVSLFKSYAKHYPTSQMFVPPPLPPSPNRIGTNFRTGLSRTRPTPERPIISFPRWSQCFSPRDTNSSPSQSVSRRRRTNL